VSISSSLRSCARFQTVPLLASPLDLAVQLLAKLERLHLGGQQQVGSCGLGLTLRFGADALCVGLRDTEDAGGTAALAPGVEEHE
jgi:hypothetical protein